MDTSVPDTYQPGTVLENKWIIIEHIGRGAMGEVYRAHQKNLNRDVAIKTISASFLAEMGEDFEDRDTAIGRFRREVQTMAQVRHPNILTIYDYGETAEEDTSAGVKTAYIVMEYIPGNSLRFTLDEDGWDDLPELYGKWIKTYFLPILDGVQVLYDNKIVHRDLKPENIFLDGNTPKIADFGLARSHKMKAVTSSLEMLGTLAYMSPEQCSDFKNADFTTDIYALGKMLFEAVHGTLTEKNIPFTSVAIEQPSTPFLVEMSRIIEKATAEKPEERYQSVGALRVDLLHALVVLEGNPDSVESGQVRKERESKLLPATVAGRIGAVLSILALSVAGMWGYHQIDGQQPEKVLERSVYTDHSDLLKNHQKLRVSAGDELQPKMLGRDGNKMLLIGSSGNYPEKPLFYMDETTITNFLFVEFLNTIREKVTVKEGIVRLGDTIIIYLDGGDPQDSGIVYKHERFHLANQNRGTSPVVRVTFHGAHLYAATYGKSLLSEHQWRYAYRFLEDNDRQQMAPLGETRVPDSSDSMMHSMTEETQTEKSSAALHEMDTEVREWITISEEHGHDGQGIEEGKSVAGVIDTPRATEDRPALKRFPWEGFSDVGFRTALAVVIE